MERHDGGNCCRLQHHQLVQHLFLYLQNTRHWELFTLHGHFSHQRNPTVWLCGTTCVVSLVSSIVWQMHPMMTSSNGNIFRVTGRLCGWIPRTKASGVELWFFYLRLNTRLSKQSLGWWFETPSHPLWRHSNDRAKAVSCYVTPHSINRSDIKGYPIYQYSTTTIKTAVWAKFYGIWKHSYP